MKIKHLLFSFSLFMGLGTVFSSQAQYQNPVAVPIAIQGIEYYYFESNASTEPAGLDTLSGLF